MAASRASWLRTVTRRFRATSIVLGVAMAALGGVTSPTVAQAPLQLPSPTVVSSQRFTAPPQVVALSSGALVVNDRFGQVIVRLRSDLSTIDTIVGSGKAAPYAEATEIVAHVGDSTLVVEPGGTTFVVVADRVCCTRAVPSLPLAPGARATLGGRATFGPTTAGGGLVFRAPMTGRGRSVGGLIAVGPDTALLLRQAYRGGKRDTVARLAVTPSYSGQSVDGRTVGITVPFARSDDWVELMDGTVAVLRSDLRVVWFSHTGDSVVSTNRLQSGAALSAGDRRRLADSALHAAPSTAGLSSGGALASRLARPRPLLRDADVELVADSLMPTTRSLFHYGSAKADMAGNIWLRQLTPSAEERYVVLNRAGERVTTVILPPGSVLAGFTKESVVVALQQPRSVGAYVPDYRVGVIALPALRRW
jgi:hypothetical protein